MKRLYALIISFFLFGNVMGQTDEFSEVFKKMIECSGMSTLLDNTINQMAPMMAQTDPNSNVSEEDFKAVMEVLVEWINDDLLPVMETLYRRHFTVEEMKQVIVFYESEIGRKFVAKQATLAVDMMHLMQDNKLQESLVKRLQNHLGVNLEQQ